jgi:hypothetical protein
MTRRRFSRTATHSARLAFRLLAVSVAIVGLLGWLVVVVPANPASASPSDTSLPRASRHSGWRVSCVRLFLSCVRLFQTVEALFDASFVLTRREVAGGVSCGYSTNCKTSCGGELQDVSTGVLPQTWKRFLSVEKAVKTPTKQQGQRHPGRCPSQITPLCWGLRVLLLPTLSRPASYTCLLSRA